MIKKLSLPLLLAMATLTASAEVVHYTIDPVHSGIQFKIRHFINKIPGTFDSFQGEIHFDKENPANSKATATIMVNSIDTRNDKRDDHLRTDDFFAAATHPTITFVSTQWEAVGENSYAVTGTLTMLGVEKEIVLDVEFLGEADNRGKTVSGWTVETEIDRTEWGLTGGRPAVGTDVEIVVDVQARRQ